MMLNQPIGADEGNHGYQRQLARSLVASCNNTVCHHPLSRPTGYRDSEREPS